MKAKLELKKHIKPELKADLTPMIDVVLILVIFFLVNTTLQKNQTLVIKPPVSVFAQATAPKRVHIELGIQDVSINGVQTTLGALTQNVAGLLSGGGVVLTADREVDYQRLVEVMDLVRNAGSDEIYLAMERADADFKE